MTTAQCQHCGVFKGTEHRCPARYAPDPVAGDALEPLAVVGRRREPRVLGDDDLLRFESKCMPEPNTGCWLWLGKTGKDNCPRFSIGRNWFVARRISYEHHVDLLREGDVLASTCLMPWCVNPSHLFVSRNDSSDEGRFWSYVQKTASCWLWAKSTKGYGYGQINIGGKKKSAHRVAWELTRGPIPDGLHVLHHCDTPRCVNPEHLFLGTDYDNKQDMVSKGRQHRWNGSRSGEQNQRAKLTEAVVIEARTAHAAGETQLSIADRLGVSRSAIAAAVCGKTWSHLRVA